MALALPLLVAMTIAARPPRLDAGDGAAAVLEIAAPGATALTLWTSTGAVLTPTARGAGRFTARYEAGPARYPRVALILVTAQVAGREEHGWLALPIHGRDTLALQTKPSSRVEVRIGKKTFGPVRSSASGRARVPVTVPPGIRTAAVQVRDSFGNETQMEFDLRPPPFQRLRMLSTASSASWVDAAPVWLEIFAVDEAGQPAPRAALSIAASRGALGAVDQRAPGLFFVPFHAPDRVAGGAARIEAKLAGSSAALETSTIAVEPGPPARIEIKPFAGALAPGGSIHLDATVVDGRGNPLLQEPVSFAADLGEVRTAGPRAAELQAPPSFGGRAVAQVVARARFGQASLDIPLLSPAAPAPLAVPQQKAWALSAGTWLTAQHNLRRAGAGGFELEAAARPDAPWELFGRALALRFASASAPIAPGAVERASLTAFGAQAGARLFLPLWAGWSLQGGGAAGLLRALGTLRVQGGPADGFSQPAARWAPMLSAAAGASLRLGKNRLLAETAFTAAPASGVVQGNLGGLSFRAGWLLDFQ